MGTYPSQYTTLIGSGSTSTSAWWWVGDLQNISVSFSSSGSLGPSRLTLEASNADGFNATLPTNTQAASAYSGINMIGITPGTVSFPNHGFRWARVTVAPANQSVASTVTVTLAGARY